MEELEQNLFPDYQKELFFYKLLNLNNEKMLRMLFFDGKEQLKETISFFNDVHPNYIGKKKYAFVANSV